MKRIEKPDICVKTILTKTTSNMINKSEMERFRVNIDEMERDEKLYSKYAEQHALHKMPEKYETEKHVSVNDMIKLYNNHLLVEHNPARKYYDRLKARVAQCPYCEKQGVDDLDHFLPKTRYSTLTITPINLVPICHSCNKKKSFYSPNESRQVMWHPYFDDYSGRWLYATLIHLEPPYFRFYVEFEDREHAPEDIKRQMNAIELTFEKLKLDLTYRFNAIDYFMAINMIAPRQYLVLGRDGVKIILRACAESLINEDKNSYMTAVMECISKDDWYVDTYLKEKAERLLQKDN